MHTLLHNVVMDIVGMLQELAKASLPEPVFARAVRALLFTATSQAEVAARSEGGPVAEPSSALGRPELEPTVGAQEPHVRFTVKNELGLRTTLSLPRSLRDVAVAAFGGEPRLSEQIRRLARQIPPGTLNRSAWVQQKLKHQIQREIFEDSAYGDVVDQN